MIERERERAMRDALLFSFLNSVWNSLAGEASGGRCSLTQRVKSIAAAGGEELGLLFWTEWP